MFDDTQLESLSVGEKRRLVTSLWDQISRSGETISVPNAVLDNSDQRVEEMMVDPSASLTEDEMWRWANELR